jgi:sulfur-carrier protein
MLVKYFADIRRLTGREQQQWTKAAPTVRELLRALAAEHGAAFEKRVLEGDDLSSTMIVLVNGQSLEHLRGMDTPLGPEDIVAVFPMVAGG